jgi:hypothetical protein
MFIWFLPKLFLYVGIRYKMVQQRVAASAIGVSADNDVAYFQYLYGVFDAGCCRHEFFRFAIKRDEVRDVYYDEQFAGMRFRRPPA